MATHRDNPPARDPPGPPHPAAGEPARAEPVADPDLEPLLCADTGPQSDEEGGDADEALRHVRFTLTRDLDKRLDKYLTDRITFMSRTQLQKLVEVGAVLVNGRTAKVSLKLHTGDTVDVSVPPPAAEGDPARTDPPRNPL